MIKITNGREVFDIPKGAFPQFATQGYHIVEENGKKISKASNSKEKEAKEIIDPEVETPQEILDLEEKPIGQWSKDEVKMYAEFRGIDLHGTKNANEAKELIKQYLQ